MTPEERIKMTAQLKEREEQASAQKRFDDMQPSLESQKAAQDKFNREHEIQATKIRRVLMNQDSFDSVDLNTKLGVLQKRMSHHKDTSSEYARINSSVKSLKDVQSLGRQVLEPSYRASIAKLVDAEFSHRTSDKQRQEAIDERVSYAENAYWTHSTESREDRHIAMQEEARRKGQAEVNKKLASEKATKDRINEMVGMFQSMDTNEVSKDPVSVHDLPKSDPLDGLNETQLKQVIERLRRSR